MPKIQLLYAVAAIIAAGAATIALGNGYSGSLAMWVAIAAIGASSLRFVMLIGELNFAVAAFYGIGAYAAGVGATIFELPFAVSLLLSGLLAGAVSVVFGFCTLQTRGPYFLLVGFAFTEVMRIIYTKSDWLGGNSGMVGIFPPEIFDAHFAVFVVLFAGIVILALYLFECSQFGKLLRAVRDNENVVRAVGIPVHWVKIACLAIACFAAGLAGGLSAYVNNVISPLDFGFLLSTFILAYLKVGGEDHPLGPVAGSALLILLGSWSMSMGGSEPIFYGASIVIALLVLPKGLLGLLRRSAKTAGGQRPVA